MDGFAGFVVFLRALDWGDVPSWLALALTVGVGLAGFAKRDKVRRWFRQTKVVPPASITSRAEGGQIVVRNHGPGSARAVRVELEHPEAGVLGGVKWFAVLPPDEVVRVPVTWHRDFGGAPRDWTVFWSDDDGQEQWERFSAG